MTEWRTRMIADRRLRDSARALVEADFQHLSDDLNRKGFTERAFDRLAEGAAEVYDEAIEVAADHKGVLAALIAAVVLWLARNPIVSLFDGEDEETDRSGAPEHPAR